MRSWNGSSALRPTIAWQATPPCRHRVATSPTILPGRVCRRAGPRRSPRRRHRACDRRSRSHRARRPRPARVARRARPRGRPRGRPPRPSSARRAGRAAALRPARGGGARAAPPCRVGALLRAEHACGPLERSSDVAQHVELGPDAGLVECLECTGPPVGRGRAADRDDHPFGAASAAAAISSPVPRVVAAHASRSSAARGRARSPGRSRQPRRHRAEAAKRASTGRPSGSGAVTCASRRRVRSRAPPSCPRRRPRPEARSPRARRSRPEAIAPATSGAEKVPLNESGATRTGCVTDASRRRARRRRRGQRTRSARASRRAHAPPRP